MIVNIEKSTASGRINAPASKSMAHRTLICGALSKQSQISGVAFSQDIKATVGCLEALGTNTEINGSTVRLGGLTESTAPVKNPLFCNESGSTLRFLLPVCLLKNKPCLLTGSKRLFERSLAVYEDICRSQNIKYLQTDESTAVCGRLKSGRYEIRGDISSQFISGLMFALPLLEKDSEIFITGKFESSSYVGLTIKALGDFGIRITRSDTNTFHIPGGQTYRDTEASVEGDYSNAAFFDALNLIGGNVLVKGLDPKSLQGDKIYREYFKLFSLKNPVFDLSDCPDLGPVLFALAAAKGGAEFTGTKRLRIKESDRAVCMAEELAKFGIPVKVEENSVTVKNAALKKPDTVLNGHNDHRIVMALSLLCTLTGGKIAGAEAVAKSLPDFFALLRALGIKVEKI